MEAKRSVSSVQENFEIKMIKLTTILSEKFFDVIPGVSLKDVFRFYNKVDDREAERVSALIHKGRFKEAREAIDKVLKR